MFRRLRCWPFALFWLTLTALAAPGCETIPTVGRSQAQVELALADQSRRTATLGGYSVEFTRLDPYPIAGQPTKTEDYRVFITINR